MYLKNLAAWLFAFCLASFSALAWSADEPVLTDAIGNPSTTDDSATKHDITLTLQDAKGNAVTGASIEITINNTVQVLTDDDLDAQYSIEQIFEGEYTLKITKGDYAYADTSITVTANTEITVNVGEIFPDNELTRNNLVIVGSYACDENTVSMMSETGDLFHSFNPELDSRGIYLGAVDFNRDDLTDIAVGGIKKGKNMLLYDTNRKPLAEIISNGDDKGVLFAFGDLDGNDNGDFEIFVTNQSADDTVNMYESTGKAIRALPVLDTKERIQIATGDVNGDGVDELVVALAEKTSGDNVLIFNQDGTLLGSFNAKPNDKNTYGLVVAVANVSGDDKAEIIIAEAEKSKRYGVAIYNEQGELQKRFNAFSGEADDPSRRDDDDNGSEFAKCKNSAYSGKGLLLASGDVDGDGTADIIVARAGYRSVKLFDGEGNMIEWFIGAEEGYQITALSYGERIGVELPDIQVIPDDVLENTTVEGEPDKVRPEIDGQEIRGTVRVANVLIVKVDIKIGANLVVGLGTRFKERASIPKGLDLRGTCHKKKKNKKHKKKHKKLKRGKKGKNKPKYTDKQDDNLDDIEVLDLTTPVVDKQPSVLEDIKVLVGDDANARRVGLRRNEAISVEQNPDNGDLEIRQGAVLIKLSPIGIEQADLDVPAGVSIDADGMLYVTTQQGQVVSMYAALHELDVFLDALDTDGHLLSLEIDDDGQMRVYYDILPNGYQVGRAHFFSDVLANQSVADGLHPASLVFPGLEQGVVLVFTDTDGSKRWQWVLPTPADRSALVALAEEASGLDSVVQHFDGAPGTVPGTVSFVINGQEFLAVFDYTVRQGTPPESGGVEFNPVDDARYEVVYPNGDRQYLFLLQ